MSMRVEEQWGGWYIRVESAGEPVAFIGPWPNKQSALYYMRVEQEKRACQREAMGYGR